MPRVTRAALRTAELQEESEIAASTPLPTTPAKKRVPLGEISENIANEAQVVELEEKLMPAKKGSLRGKKGSAAKKINKPKKGKAMNRDSGILEDGNESTASSAVEEACQDLLKDTSDVNQVVLDDGQTPSPPSEAVNTVSQQMSLKITPFQSEIEAHKFEGQIVSDTATSNEDSFLAKIESRTPAKMTSADDLDDQSGNDGKNEDSFIGHIKTCSPGRRTSRIEDSVEALDVLEDEIEKVDKLIPINTDKISGTTRSKDHVVTQAKTAEKKMNGSVRIKNNRVNQASPAKMKPSLNVRSAASEVSVHPAIKKATTPLKASQTIPSTGSQSPALIRKSSRARPLATHKRISSVHKPPFRPTKSTKPPTQSKFELPGEAISRRLKEQREERLRREGGENVKQHVPKARPMRLSQAPVVKLTATTKTRIDLAKGELVNKSKSTDETPKSTSAPRSTPKASIGAKKRSSSLSINKRTSAVQPTANSSARVTRKPSLVPSGAACNPATSCTSRAAPTAEDLALQKVKGKEVFGRTKAEIIEREKARKEKEEAAKRARAEAAERGRVASREWAEKQKQRKMEALKANSEVKIAAA